MTEKSPPLSYLRPFITLVAFILLIGSVGLFFLPHLVMPRWPWALAPYHARFLGAVYAAEMSAVLILLVVNRWAPARLSVPVAVMFTLVVSLASLLHLDSFDLGRRAVRLWFFLYLVSFVITAVMWWAYRRPAEQVQPLSPRWQRLLTGQAVVYGVYGLAMFFIPQQATTFWPWPVDAFHANIYSAVFFSAAAGAWIIRREAAPIELFTFGLSQLVLGSFAIAGLLIVDVQLQRINWMLPGTWLWITGWLLLAILGGGLLMQARTQHTTTSTNSLTTQGM
jgi:hypothetical protein